jgi:site-specific recombinase XerD
MATTPETESLLDCWPRFALSLKSEHRSPKTVTTYHEAVKQFSTWLEENGRSTAVGELKRADIEGFISAILAKSKPATAASRYRSLHRFFAWLLDEEEIAASPMLKTHPPKVELDPPPVLTEAQLVRLLRACEGPRFLDRRDMALVRTLLDTGCRLGEVVNMAVTDIDKDYGVLHVVGKGRRPRAAPIGPKTGIAISRYLKARRTNPRADSPRLWLGQKGPMTNSGVFLAVQHRGELAGLGHIHPHQFRHTFAHRWQLNEGNETDLMMLLGWRSRGMLNRYAASAGAERAAESHRKMALGDL